MADTYPLQALALSLPSNSFLSYATRTLEEGITETFSADAPIVITAGLVVEAASPATAVHGFAVRAGQNNAAAAAVLAEFVPAMQGLEIFGNLLSDSDPSLNNGATGTAEAFVRADVGANVRLKFGNILAGSAEAWYFGDNSTTGAVQIIDTKSDYTFTEAAGTGGKERPAVGDFDVRLTAVMLEAIRTFNT